MGRKGITCVELPRRSGRGVARLAGGADTFTCRAVGVAERFLHCQTRLVIQQACWHPAAASSAFDGHLAVLASDNYLRVYDLDSDCQTPEQSLPLGRSGGGDQSRFFADSSVSVQGSLGETAVDFAFAPPLAAGEEEDEESSCLWPVFLLYGNGTVYCTLTGLGDSKPSPHRVCGER